MPAETANGGGYTAGAADKTGGSGSAYVPDACRADALNSTGCGWLPRLLCPGSTFRSSKYQPSVAHARQAVGSIAKQRATASLRAAEAHNVMSVKLADSVARAATSVAEAAAAAAGVSSAGGRAAAAALLEARKQALMDLVTELGERRQFGHAASHMLITKQLGSRLPC